jgi:hypothetical protein
VRTVDYVGRWLPPLWLWPILLGYLVLAVSVGYLLGWYLAALAAVGVAPMVMGRRRTLARTAILALLAVCALVQLLLVGGVAFFAGGIELQRDNRVDAARLRAATAVPGAVANPFVDSEARELYLVGLDAKSQGRLPRLADVLGERFGMAATQTAPLLLDLGVLNQAREQLDGQMITSRLLSAHSSAHPLRPAIVIAVTRLDLFFSDIPDYRFAFMTSRAGDDNAICGGVISTARFDVWPGSEETRLGNMAGRLLGRCLGIEEDASILSVDDVDRLDGRAGADRQTIARHVAERRALPGASRR